ncbi:MAG: restriction endonuclease subunit S [Flammeovirgaceae bacterium]|nr:restriction endonuclease subunit S [Flammeovirgaceae bacterium]
MRELILELAVRGKLVPQDSHEEHADILLKRITKERNRLIEEGSIKQGKQFEEIRNDEIPYKLPEGWAWTRFPTVCNSNVGRTPSTKNPLFWSDKPGGIPWVSISDMIHDGFILETDKYISSKAAKDIFRGQPVSAGTLLMSFKLTVGKISILDIDAFHNEAIISIYPFKGMNRDYLFKCLPEIARQGNTKKAIMGNTLNATSLALLLIPIPPEKEQHCIVAKVNELMSLCDELEQQETNHLKSHQLLVETLLGTLTTAADAKEFQTAWSSLAQHFDDLFTTEDSIDQLKQTILQLAIMGKLVPQDPKDEPASVLLGKIEIEKERLIKENFIKQEKPLPPISADEIPYKLPEGWQWCRMKDLCPNISSGSTPPKIHFKESGIPYLKVYNIRSQKIDFEYQEQFVDEKYHRTKLSRSILRPGDVIMNIVGPPLGKVAIIPDNYPEWNCNQAITFFQPLEKRMNKWIYTYLLAGTFLNYIELIGTAGQDNISVTKSKMIMVPLAPISEQFRIVKKVDELFALCDRLKEGIGESQKVVNLMANSIVEHCN